MAHFPRLLVKPGVWANIAHCGCILANYILDVGLYVWNDLPSYRNWLNLYLYIYTYYGLVSEYKLYFLKINENNSIRGRFFFVDVKQNLFP